MGRPFHHPDLKDVTLDGILHALSDPIRCKIILKLAGCTSMMSCSKTCSLAPSTISFHYRILREAGLVRSEKKGVEVVNTLRREEIEGRFPGLMKAVLTHDDMVKQLGEDCDEQE